jgi:membrane protein
MGTGLRDRLYDRLSAERTRADLDRLNKFTERGALRVLRTAITGFNCHNDMLWASALTYTSSLSLVPILAVGLSALKGLGGADRIKPLIERFLAVNSPDIANAILGFVGNINAKTLGAVGGATLLITVILTLGTIEQALNTIFSVPRGRTWMRKFTDYLSITFTVPLLVTAAVPLKATLQSQMPHLPGLAWMAATIPIWAGFSVLYLFFPNTRVRWHCAALGGLAAAILLEGGQWAYIRFQVGAGRYQAIYGALAAVPILLTWIYIAWIIVLSGAELTAAAQGIEPSFDLDYRSPGFMRMAAILTVFRAGERMIARDASPCTIHSLASELGVAESALRPVLDRLGSQGIIIESSEASSAGAQKQGIFLARDSSAISLAEVLGCIETAPSNTHGDQRIASLLESLKASQREAMGTLTVRDLISGHFDVSGSAKQQSAEGQ